MTVLNGSEIAAVNDLPVEQVPTPEWGACRCVYVRTLTAAESEEVANFSKEEGGNFLARLAAFVVCDEKGKRLFGDEDAEMLGGKSRRVIERICDAALDFNGLSDETQKDAEKN